MTPADEKAGAVTQEDRPPKASERTTRDWREVVAALSQKTYDQISALKEGYGSVPAPAEDALRTAIAAFDDFDRHMAKIDKRSPAVGGEYVAEIRRAR